MCVNELFQFWALPVHTVQDSFLYRHEKLSGTVWTWPKMEKNLFVLPRAHARALIDSFNQGVHPTLEIDFETYLTHTYT